jgi:hypothetical protein
LGLYLGIVIMFTLYSHLKINDIITKYLTIITDVIIIISAMKIYLLDLRLVFVFGIYIAFMIYENIKYKNSFDAISTKQIGTAVVTIGIIKYVGIDYMTFVLSVAGLSYILLTTNVEALKDKTYNVTNIIIIAIVAFVSLYDLNVSTGLEYSRLCSGYTNRYRDYCSNYNYKDALAAYHYTSIFYIHIINTIITMIMLFIGLDDKYVSRKNDDSATKDEWKFVLAILMLAVMVIKLSTILPSEISMTIISIFLLTYIVLITRFNKFSAVNNETFNVITICSMLTWMIFSSFGIREGVIQFIVNVSLGFFAIYLMSDERYTTIKFVQKYRGIIYSIYATLVIIILNTEMVKIDSIYNLVASILLMILAFINVYIGLKLRIKEMRKYGLMLACMVCLKLIFIDLYSFDFMVKAALFMVIGIIALSVSYMYNKLDIEDEIEEDYEEELEDIEYIEEELEEQDNRENIEE